MNKFFSGIVIGMILVLAGGYFFVVLGGMPVATQGPPLPFERFLAKKALHFALRKATDLKPPIEASPLHLLAGAKSYQINCAVCHGLPHQPISAIAMGMFPPPPQLFETKEMVTDDPAGTVFWKIRNGIRLTGMPGFNESLTELESWQITLLLINADKLSESVLRRLKIPPH